MLHRPESFPHAALAQPVSEKVCSSEGQESRTASTLAAPSASVIAATASENGDAVLDVALGQKRGSRHGIAPIRKHPSRTSYQSGTR